MLGVREQTVREEKKKQGSRFVISLFFFFFCFCSTLSLSVLSFSRPRGNVSRNHLPETGKFASLLSCRGTAGLGVVIPRRGCEAGKVGGRACVSGSGTGGRGTAGRRDRAGLAGWLAGRHARGRVWIWIIIVPSYVQRRALRSSWTRCGISRKPVRGLGYILLLAPIRAAGRLRSRGFPLRRITSGCGAWSVWRGLVSFSMRFLARVSVCCEGWKNASGWTCGVFLGRGRRVSENASCYREELGSRIRRAFSLPHCSDPVFMRRGQLHGVYKSFGILQVANVVLFLCASSLGA